MRLDIRWAAFGMVGGRVGREVRSHPSVVYKRGLDVLVDGNWVELSFDGNMDKALCRRLCFCEARMRLKTGAGLISSITPSSLKSGCGP